MRSMNNLHAQTLKLLNESKIPLPEIARGSNVGYRWLCQLIAGRYTDPGVQKIQRIHNFLVTGSVSAEAATLEEAHA